MRIKALITLFSLTLSTAVGAQAGPAHSSSSAHERQLMRLVQGLVEAQRNYDQRTLRQLTAPDYVEISPRGEIDVREKMLSFYAERPDVPAPVISTRFESFRTYGSVSVIVATMNMTMSDGKGGATQHMLRASMIARCAGAACKLVLAQYTPVR